MKRHGVGALNVSNIAREVGITRQTFYRYFDNVEMLCHSAINSVGDGIIFRVSRHLQKYKTPAERAVESLIFMYQEIPKDRLLVEIFFGVTPPKQVVDIVFSPASLKSAAEDAAQILFVDKREGVSSEHLREITELMVRLLWSLLTIPNPQFKDENYLRALLKTWVGIPVQVLFGDR